MKKYYIIISAIIVAAISIYNLTRENTNVNFLTNSFESIAIDPDEVNNLEGNMPVRGFRGSNWTNFTVYCPGEWVTYSNTSTGESKTIFVVENGKSKTEAELGREWKEVIYSSNHYMITQGYIVCTQNGKGFCWDSALCPCMYLE